MPSEVSRQAPGAPAIDSRTVKRAGDRMLAYLDAEEAELSILLTDDTTIHGLNREHRGVDRATDVLAFALEEADEPGSSEPLRVLGDVVISLDTAERQGRARGSSLGEEVTFLLAHGVLHLFGYDHQTDEEEAEMDAATKVLVAAARRREA